MDVLDAVVSETTTAKPAVRKTTKRERAGRIERQALGMVFAGSVSVEQWEAEGRELARGNWILGDWWIYGERRWGDAKARAESLGLVPGTLSNIASVARRFPLERRREDLTWTHHQVVAYMDDTDAADALLARAASERMTVAALRQAMGSARAPAARRAPAKPVTPASVKAVSAPAKAIPAAGVKVVGAAVPAGAVAPSVDTVRLERELSGLRQDMAHIRKVLELGPDDPILPALRRAVELARKYGAEVEAAAASRVKVVAA